MDAQGEIDVSRLTDRDKQELQQFIVNETQKSKIQQSVHNLTDICWTKCITGAIKNKGLDKSEESCAKNCVDRFLDANFLVIKQLENVVIKSSEAQKEAQEVLGRCDPDEESLEGDWNFEDEA